MACVFVYVIVLAFLGPENLGRKFDVAHDSDLAEVTGSDAIEAVVHKRGGKGGDRNSSDADEQYKEGTKAHEAV